MTINSTTHLPLSRPAPNESADVPRRELSRREPIAPGRRPKNAPFSRRARERVLTSWQPFLSPFTRDKTSTLHRAASFLSPRIAPVFFPAIERGEASLQPTEYRGWERHSPRSVLQRPRFQDLEEFFDVPLEVIHGSIPTGLKGHIFWQSFSHEMRHELRFMGRSMLLRLDPEPTGELRLSGRKLVTPSQVFKAHADPKDAFRFLRALLWISPTAGFAGDYGQGLLTVNDALIVTANTVRPMLVDKKTLEVKSPFGRSSDYHPSLPMAVPFPPRYSSAHSFYDAITSEYFSVNYGYGFTRVVIWKPEWPGFRSFLVEDERGRLVTLPQSNHQLMVTQDFVVIFNNDGHLLDFPNPFCQDTVAFVVSRAELQEGRERVRGRRFRLPMTASHQIANYSNPGGVITFFTSGTVPFAPDMSGVLPNDYSQKTGRYYSDVNWGTFPLSQSDMAHIARYRLDTRSGRLIDFRRISDPRYTWNAQYNVTKIGMGVIMPKHGPRCLDTLYTTFFGFNKDDCISRMTKIFKTTRHSNYTFEELPERPVPGALVAIDADTWTIRDAYTYDIHTQPGHACNIPTEDGKTYFIAPAQSADEDRFMIFDPDNLAGGPVCTLRSPVTLPYVQHTTWTENLETSRVRYPVDLEEDLIVPGIIPSVERVVRDHVLPYFSG